MSNCDWCGQEVESDSLFTRSCKNCCGQIKLEKKYYDLGIKEFTNKLKRRFNEPSASDVIENLLREESE